jgi:hypothetical protein
MRAIKLLTIFLLGAAFAAAQPCSPADARGTYLFKTWGWHDLGPSHPSLPNSMGPAYGLGIVTLDGAGKGSGRFTATFGGVVQTLEYVDLQYTVSENCGGTARYRLKAVETNTVLGPDELELRILDDGARIRGLMTDSGGRGAILTSEFQRLSRGPRACHPSMLRGTYSMYYEGWINMQMLNPNQPAYFAPESGLGVFVLDPDGTNRGSAAHTWGGVRVTTDLATGTFNVNADCTGVFDYVMQIRGTQNRMSGKSLFVLSGDGAQLSVLMLNPPGLQYYERVSIP